MENDLRVGSVPPPRADIRVAHDHQRRIYEGARAGHEEKPVVQVAGMRLADGMQVRLMAPDDQATVLALIAADRLPGQPDPDPHLVTRPARDGLAKMVTLVLTSADGTLRGVAQCAMRVSNDAGLIGWLHAREDFDALAALIAAARSHLGPVPMLYAGTGPTQPSQAIPLALPGIAEQHRPNTTRALYAVGFTPATSHYYFHHPLTPPPTRPLFPLAELRPLTDPPGVQRSLAETDGSALATAILHTDGGDHWLLWHLTVRADRRHRGIGSHLLTHCLHTAHTHGATSVTAHTDENDQPSTRLFTSSGFTTVDILNIHHRRRP